MVPDQRQCTQSLRRFNLWSYSMESNCLHTHTSIDGPNCGEELNYPLFYVTPIIELSDCPFLPVYHFKLSSGNNPRHHNFHLISDILDSLEITEQKLLKHCNKVLPLEMTVAKVMEQMETSYYKLPEKVLSFPPHKTLRFLPLCNRLRKLLDIDVENLDD